MTERYFYMKCPPCSFTSLIFKNKNGRIKQRSCLNQQISINRLNYSNKGIKVYFQQFYAKPWESDLGTTAPPHFLFLLQ